MAKLTVKASMPMIEGGMIALNRETDLQLAEAAIPPNIELMEGMIINDPNHEDLRNYVSQAYYGYAYGFVEDHNSKRASAFYQRGLNHALYNLQQAGISDNDLNGNLDKLQKKINALDSDNTASLFWAASNWAKFIDHNRDKPEAIAGLPKAAMLMQRVIELDETFYMAGPHIFFGVYYGSRSPLLGGNHALSEKHFEKARLFNKHELFIVDLLQAEFLDRQRFDQENFHQRLINIIQSKPSSNIDFSLINNIAKQKAKKILAKEQEWF